MRTERTGAVDGHIGAWSRFRRCRPAALAACAVMVWSCVAHAERRPLASEDRATVERVGPWEVFAADRRVDGARVVYEQIEARTAGDGGDWRMAADRLEVRRAPVTGRLQWLMSTGNVRIDGPDELYARADRAWTLRPYVDLYLSGDETPATAGADQWRLGAERVRLHLESKGVELDRLVGRKRGRQGK